jgi:hypothetical protein
LTARRRAGYLTHCSKSDTERPYSLSDRVVNFTLKMRTRGVAVMDIVFHLPAERQPAPIRRTACFQTSGGTD